LNLDLDLQPLPRRVTSLEHAILETLAYSDVFNYPLRLEELHRFLPVPASLAELEACVDELDWVESNLGYYFLRGREQIVALRLQREESLRRPYDRAIRYGRILGLLPFIRMVALTGSLAVQNSEASGDYDYMLVTQRGRVWLARAFALLLNRVARLSGETLCPNLIVSEDALRWNAVNLYSARELCQMVLICGRRTVGFNLRVANLWVADYFPNFKCASYQSLKDINFFAGALRGFLEFLLNNRLGDRLEAWEMNRKIARLSRQDGLGPETLFSPEVCQGNFDHHGSATLARYQQRLQQIYHDSDKLVSGPMQEQPS